MKKTWILSLILLAILSNCATIKTITHKNDWDNMKYPEITFVNVDSLGSGLYYEGFIPDPDALIRQTALNVCKRLYKSPSEVPEVKKLHYSVFNFNGISYKGGDFSDTHVAFSSQYMKNQVDMGTSKKVIIDEVVGVLTHELTHAFQSNTEYKDDGWSVIEGIADAVRYLEGYFDVNERRVPGGNYNGGYTTTGFFICWIMETKDEDFLYRLNQYVKGQDKFYWKPAMQELMNADVEDLWNEYQDYLTSEFGN